MAKNTQLSNAAANAQADALTVLANSGFVKIYDGTQPATGDTAISTQVLLATLTFGSTAFGSSVAGVSTANAIGSAAAAAATGTASWFRVLKSDATTVLWDGSVGTSGANLNVGSTAFQINAQIDITSLTYTVHKNTSGY